MESKALSLVISENIESLMERQGYNGVSLAEKAGLSRTAVHAILKGRIASPRVDTLERIADALGVTIYELMADMSDEELIAEINALIAAIPEKERPRIRDMIAGFVRMLPTAAV